VDQYVVAVCGKLAEIASSWQSLVDTVGRWKNGPAYFN